MAKRKRKLKTGGHRAPARRRKAPVARAAEAALAGIAHDIRTPLTGLVALAELLAASDLGDREREWAQAIKSGADHLAALSTLIVDAVRGEAASLLLRPEPFSPRALAVAVGGAFTARAGSKGLSAEITIAEDLPALVTGDALRLRAALENLADNAVKFTHDGSVRFSAAAEEAARDRLRLVFTFADSGIGMTPVELKRLFRPFAQASEDIARRYGGAGLGLTFVKRIAKKMGGDLTVTSKRGKGSTFRLTALVDAASPERDAQAGAPQTSARALKLLCVEDNPYGRVVMNTILREFGHRVDFVESGEAAIAAIGRGGYDAVLMDVTLSGIDGLETTRRIRALPDVLGRVPVLGISGRDRAGDEEAARAAGMNFYLTKPVSPRKLAEALASLA
ncbi:ATP-binding protein [Microbacteriaceae bacterium K1510]|nr:ATP-binding protein [Microbacteriaceae bacterium K1510]